MPFGLRRIFAISSSTYIMGQMIPLLILLSREKIYPTAENLLEAFQEINLNVATIGQQVHRYITPLSELQQKILVLLDFPANIYTRLATASQNPP